MVSDFGVVTGVSIGELSICEFKYKLINFVTVPDFGLRDPLEGSSESSFGGVTVNLVTLPDFGLNPVVGTLFIVGLSNFNGDSI
jgi:hypothetical protein